MASVNKVILVGNCGRDPEIRYLPSGQAVANVSVATSSRRKDKNTGETVEDTQWHRVTFYDRLAEIAGEYVKKGRPIYVEGRLKYGKYTDQAGIEKNTVDIIATELQLLGGREGMGGPGEGEDGGGRMQRPQTAERQVGAVEAELRPDELGGDDDTDQEGRDAPEHRQYDGRADHVLDVTWRRTLVGCQYGLARHAHSPNGRRDTRRWRRPLP